MKKLILCDLDGTLLRTDKTISKASADALNRCKEKGILVGFSTSRGRTTTETYEEIIQPDILICNGGATVFCKNECICMHTFTREQTQALLNATYRECGEECEITLDTIDELYWNRTYDKSTPYGKKSIYSDFKNFTQCALKICVQTEDSTKAKRIAQSVDDCDYLPFSDIPWYKFSSALATKDNAIKTLCTHLNIQPSEIVAFGDDYNDSGMLTLCGTGVAMGNAIAEVKAIADDVTLSNDDDGIAVWLKKNILS